MAATMTNEQLLAEVEDILRTVPPKSYFIDHKPDTLPWIGRAAAAIRRWNVVYTIPCDGAIRELGSLVYVVSGYNGVMKLLYQAQADLRMEVGQLSVVVPTGNVLDYFEGLRKMVETARVEVFFVDRYLDADFVPRYLPYVADGVNIRLLGRPQKMATLLPSVDLFVEQYHRPVQVRASKEIHDRYLFVDQTTCYFSGASFRDGARHSPALLSQITDAFQAMWDTYDGLWQTGKVER
jgi:hypothetical protein